MGQLITGFWFEGEYLKEAECKAFEESRGLFVRTQRFVTGCQKRIILVPLDKQVLKSNLGNIICTCLSTGYGHIERYCIGS